MIIGHKKIWQFLENSYKTDRLSHAYLFLGEESLGKRKLAKEFIKLINCKDSKGEPCQVCRSCQDIEKEVHPDFTVIEPEKPSSAKATEGKQEIKISQIRKLQHSLSLRSYSAKYKSVIINECQSLNQEAYSCLLKTLEEPSGRTILILISSTADSLPKTILSRVEQIKFQSVDRGEIENYFKKESIKENLAKEISSASAGKPGLAINYSKSPEILEKEKALISDLIKMKKSSLATRFQYAKDLVEKQDLGGAIKIWTKFLRNLLLFKVGSGQNQIYQDFYKDADDFSVQKIKKVLNLFINFNLLISTTNANSRLALETLMIEI